MELREVTESLKYLPPQIVVWVSSNSKCVKNGSTKWTHKWKSNEWKNAKKGGVAYATFWSELDTTTARPVRVEFTWVYAHSGILLNECADQLATLAVVGVSYGPGTIVPPGEPESEVEFVMEEEDITQRDDWSDHEHLPQG
jgi:ribonuclease HI